MSPVFRGQEDLIAIAKVAALLLTCSCLIIVLNLIERRMAKAPQRASSKPEELPLAAVRAPRAVPRRASSERISSRN
jgi:hypothetical protein